MTRPGRIPYAFLAAALGGLLALWFLRQALAPFFIALVLAYLLDPLVERLARRMPRPMAVVLVLLGSLAFLLLLGLALKGPLEDQLQRLGASLPRWKSACQARLLPWIQARPWLAQHLQGVLEGFDPMVILRGLGGAGLTLLGTFLQVLTFVLVPVILYYLLLDGPVILERVTGLVPPRHRPAFLEVCGEIHRRLGGYIRGQLAVCAAMSVLQGAGFACFGLPYPWLLGLVAGFANLVPYSPYLLALPPALLLALLDGAGGTRLLLLALAFTAIQKAEALYFTPVWVGRASRLHPLEVLLGVLAFGSAFGLVGLVFAVPLAIVLKVGMERGGRRYREHAWFKKQSVELAGGGQGEVAAGSRTGAEPPGAEG